MAWNKPGSDDDNRNQGSNQGGGNNDTPPDLDQILKDAKDKFDNLIGGGKKSSGGDGNNDRGGPNSINISGAGFGLILLVGLIIWGATGFYTVEEGTEAVELRFGDYTETKAPGLRWHLPYPIEEKIIVNTSKVNTVEVGYRGSGRGANRGVPEEALMLTEDENILDVQVAVQYNISNPIDFLFNVVETTQAAEAMVRQTTESALREVIGGNTMDFAFTQGRGEIAQQTKILLQDILNRYGAGINIRSVEMQNTQPPEPVQDAFNDAVAAREDEERLKSLAEAYANDVIPRAEGAAARILQDAEAYKESVMLQASGEASRFGQVLEEYQKAPSVTRKRLYLDTMQEVLGNSTKMLIDNSSASGNNNLLYLPLDKLLQNQPAQQQNSTRSSQPSVPVNTPSESRSRPANIPSSTRQSRF